MSSDQVALRLADLAERHSLADRAVEQLAGIVRMLAADAHAPTSIRDPIAAVEQHIADALTALDLDAVRRAGDVVDIGAGTGVPGLPLAVALPNSTVTLLESHARKCDFMLRAQALAGVANVRVVCARAEDWQAGLGANDLALARALAAAPVVLEYAAPLLKLGGVLVEWRGRRSEEEDRAALAAARELGLRREEVRKVQPFPQAHDRHLHVYAKIGPTPERFPRRAGMARKRPLGRGVHDLEAPVPPPDRDRR